MRTDDKPTLEAGSDRLESMLGKRSEITKQDLSALVKLTRQKGVKIQDIWIKGKPGIDVLHGSIRADKATAAKVVQGLMELSSARLRFEVFPIGIIDPEEWDIRFKTPGGP